LPDASFAGQQETFLNIHGIDHILHAIREVFASLYNDRAISYRVHKDFTHADVALSAGIQRMVRSDLGASGVMFTLDTESGFRDAVFITSSYGLGEMVVQGAVNPDEFYVHKQQLAAGFPAVIRRSLGSKQQRMVFDVQRSAGRSTRIEPVPVADQSKFSLNDEDVLQLARYAVSIEKHYGRPMDIEWGKDGNDGKLYILQARPETVKSNASNGATEKYRLQQRGVVLVEGRAIGQKIGTGRVRIVGSTAEMDKVQAGDVLVTDMTDPNWEPVMKRAAPSLPIAADEPVMPRLLRVSWVFQPLLVVDMRLLRYRKARLSRHPAQKAIPAMYITATCLSRSLLTVKMHCHLFLSS
jgi:pyruvate,water dikinase